MSKFNSTSIPVYTLRYISASLSVLLLTTLSAITIFGIYHEFLEKKQEAQEYANLIALTAGMPEDLGIALYGRQISDIITYDPLIPKIEFFEVENATEMQQDSRSDFLIAFKNDIYSVYTNVIHETSLNEQIREQLFKSFNITMFSNGLEDSLVGYISVSIDVKALRQRWLEEHLWLMGCIVSIYILVAMWVYKLTLATRRQASELKNIAQYVLDNDEMATMPMTHVSMDFLEYGVIQQALIKFFEQNKQLNERFEALKNSEVNYEAQDEKLTNQLAQFQYLISHDLKTSVNAIIGGSQLLSQQYLSEEQNDALTIIRRGSRQLNFILDQIIELNKVEKGQVSINNVEFNPLQLISELVSEYQVIAEKKNLVLMSDVSHMDYRLEGDSTKIYNIFKIIIDNAIKYTEKGAITIDSTLQHFDNSTRWTVRIKDTGIGIDSNELSDVFAPFYRANNEINTYNEGIGIGLTLAKQLAELLNAKITIESEIGLGTVVELVIPLLEKKQKIERQLLKGLNVVCFQGQQSENDSVSREIEHFGAKNIEVFNNVDAVVDYLADEHIDVLFIYSDVSEHQVLRLSRKFRGLEKNHRSFIVWLYTDEVKTVSDEMMESFGIDIAMAMTTPYVMKEVAIKINQWYQ